MYSLNDIDTDYSTSCRAWRRIFFLLLCYKRNPQRLMNLDILFSSNHNSHKIYQLKGLNLKPKNKGHTIFYECKCCNLTEKVYLEYAVFKNTAWRVRWKYHLFNCSSLIVRKQLIIYSTVINLQSTNFVSRKWQNMY